MVLRRAVLVSTFLVAFLLAASWLAAQSAGKQDDDAIRAYLDRIHGQPGMMNVPRADGKFLHDLIIEKNYRQGLEIGTSNGYSGIWMGMAMRRTGGKLITLEIDQRRAALARENFAKVGLDDVIELREGNALDITPRLDGPFDFVFIDAWKPDYIAYLRLVLPKVRSGGAIVAHNVLSHSEDMQDFLKAVQTHPELETRIERLSSAGLSVSFKRGLPDTRKP